MNLTKFLRPTWFWLYKLPCSTERQCKASVNLLKKLFLEKLTIFIALWVIKGFDFLNVIDRPRYGCDEIDAVDTDIDINDTLSTNRQADAFLTLSTTHQNMYENNSTRHWQRSHILLYSKQRSKKTDLKASSCTQMSYSQTNGVAHHKYKNC